MEKQTAKPARRKFMTAADTAKFLCVTVDYLYQLTKARRVPFYKPFGKLIYFDRAEIETLIGNKKVCAK